MCPYMCLYTCLYICLHACLYAFLYACRHAGLYVCPYTCLYTCLYACLYMHVYTHVYIHISIPIAASCVHASKCMPTRHACTHAQKNLRHASPHACLHVYMPRHVHVHVRTHGRAHVSRRMAHAPLPPRTGTDEGTRECLRATSAGMARCSETMGGRRACVCGSRKGKKTSSCGSPARTRCLATTCAGEADRHEPTLGENWRGRTQRSRGAMCATQRCCRRRNTADTDA